MEALIQVRRGTAAQWIAANPVMADGEPGLETDTGKGKYGKTGVHWVDLPYSWPSTPIGPAGGSLSGTYPNPTLGINSVGSSQIIDGSIGTADIGDTQVTKAKLAPDSVDSSKIVDLSVTLGDLAPNSVDTSKIIDGSIGLGDLNSGTVNSLMTDVQDEGSTVAVNAGIINFVGAGVTAAGAGGVATVTIPGGGGSGVSIPAGTMADWYDPTPPAGWYMCDGGAHADLGGTLGSRYGASAGTTPNIDPRVPDQSFTQADVIASNLAGYSVTGCSCRLAGGWLAINVVVQRTGANVALNNINYADQALFTFKPNFIPDFGMGGIGNNVARHFQVSSTSGQVVTTSGMSDDSYTASDIHRDDVFGITFHYPIKYTNTLPKIYTIIKAP